MTVGRYNNIHCSGGSSFKLCAIFNRIAQIVCSLCVFVHRTGDHNGRRNVATAKINRDESRLCECRSELKVDHSVTFQRELRRRCVLDHDRNCVTRRISKVVRNDNPYRMLSQLEAVRHACCGGNAFPDRGTDLNLPAVSQLCIYQIGSRNCQRDFFTVRICAFDGQIFGYCLYGRWCRVFYSHRLLTCSRILMRVCGRPDHCRLAEREEVFRCIVIRRQHTLTEVLCSCSGQKVHNSGFCDRNTLRALGFQHQRCRNCDLRRRAVFYGDNHLIRVHTTLAIVNRQCNRVLAVDQGNCRCLTGNGAFTFRE